MLKKRLFFPLLALLTTATALPQAVLAEETEHR